MAALIFNYYHLIPCEQLGPIKIGLEELTRTVEAYQA
jgi:hypothetical protein